MNKELIVMVTNIPNQYRIPLFNELHLQLERKGMSLHVIFGAIGYQRRSTKIDLTDCQFSYEILPSGWLRNIEYKTGFMFYCGLKHALQRLKPARIIVAGYSFATIKLWAKSWWSDVKYYIWSGSIARKGKEHSSLRIFQRKLLIRRAQGFIAYGSLAKKNFELFGADPSKVIAVGNTVDTIYFEKETQRMTQLQSDSKRKHLTYVGYLTPRKNVRLLIEVVYELSLIRNDFVFDIVGDGECREELEKLALSLNLGDKIFFHGFQQKQELPKYLAKSNCFLFQTDFDIWGLVLNEAMAAGVPCLASTNAGATEDLIIEGVTGFKVNFENTLAIVEKVNWVLNQPEEMKKIGSTAKTFIGSNYSLSKCAENMISIF